MLRFWHSFFFSWCLGFAAWAPLAGLESVLHMDWYLNEEKLSSPRVVRFAMQFPARTLGGVTLFVQDDLRDAFFVGVAVVVDCLFTFSQ